MGTFKTKLEENQLAFFPTMNYQLQDMIQMMQIEKYQQQKNVLMDFSHQIKKFRVGKNRSLRKLEKKYPEFIKTDPLDGVEYSSDKQKQFDGHSKFVYTLKIIPIKIGRRVEMIFSSFMNWISLKNQNPYMVIKFNFAPYFVEYRDGRENMFEFLGYLIGIFGGILILVKYFYNFVWWFFQKEGDQTTVI